jgi:S1-C subfamily serine protease
LSPLRAPLGALVVAAALVLWGCGDDSGSSGSVTTVSAPDSSSKTVVVHSRGGAFDPGAIYDEASPGVVTVRSLLPGGSSLLDAGGGVAEGAGFVLSAGGEIATAAHVVTDAEESGGGSPIHEATEVYVQFVDRNQVPAQIVGFDAESDTALLKVDPSGLDMHPLQLGNSDDVRTGEPTAAIGSPFLQDRSLTVGVVSGVDRAIPSLTRFQIENAIQTDASINPGNSGGPLLDVNGDVIGINQQINTTSGGNQGVAFAVPINLVKRSLDQLRANGTVKYAYIGVSTQSLYPQLADRLELPSESGALVARVVPGGPADEAGIQGSDQEIRFQAQEVSAGGDVIVAIDGHKILSEADLPELIASYEPGDSVTLQIIRDGETQEVDVTLGERPSSAA